MYNFTCLISCTFSLDQSMENRSLNFSGIYENSDKRWKRALIGHSYSEYPLLFTSEQWPRDLRQ